MKTLNELTPKERIELYKKALVDWTERPNDYEVYTEDGLCHYFFWSCLAKCLSINEFDLCNEWVNHVYIPVRRGDGYIGERGDPIPRIAALNAMIKELEEML